MSGAQALIIEDYEDTAVVFANALREAGFEAEILRAGDEAIARLAGPPPAVVILDLDLPRISGVEILHRIRADERLEGTNVIVATAFPDLAADVEEEADLVLIKPVSFSQLRDLVSRLRPA